VVLRRTVDNSPFLPFDNTFSMLSRRIRTDTNRRKVNMSNEFTSCTKFSTVDYIDYSNVC